MYYGDNYYPPRVLGQKNADRMIRELSLDNCGMCRFHRQWAEDMIGDFINEFYSEQINFNDHHKKLAMRIHEMGKPRPLGSSRVIDIVQKNLERTKESGVIGDELDYWIDAFRKDKWGAARAFWFRMRQGANDVLGASGSI